MEAFLKPVSALLLKQIRDKCAHDTKTLNSRNKKILLKIPSNKTNHDRRQSSARHMLNSMRAFKKPFHIEFSEWDFSLQVCTVILSESWV